MAGSLSEKAGRRALELLHGSYHRGHVAAAVRGAGEEPVNTDFISFAREGR